jgi:hypothetical protein
MMSKENKKKKKIANVFFFFLLMPSSISLYINQFMYNAQKKQYHRYAEELPIRGHVYR